MSLFLFQPFTFKAYFLSSPERGEPTCPTGIGGLARWLLLSPGSVPHGFRGPRWTQLCQVEQALMETLTNVL